ncbi:sporulation integral membrane protein YlbJ [Tumebacillus permanentifrigoris]|uniref:Sporulation integral membrane protein YlbJ n=1 Tax=Tumebacillus permanentifrigoris TaxID=378543 RepID=A0A316DBG4_9BACL|nr:sporulation integral membrane protein YlbJ [Tumebacillus permanentifrigoris]PWK15541.1 sporulation integral membrane protein YlbJ [Tumebacillus permanentifrigoris]
MSTSPARLPKRFSTMLLATAVVCLTMALVFYPEDGYKAGLAGMKLFWQSVFPSLLPFLILAELLLGVGVVHAAGVLLEPLMRLLFRVPGVGAFAVSMGVAAGYPVNAVVTSKFRKNKLVTRVEAERLLACSTAADPLFLCGAIAIGLFHSPQLGLLLAIAHYLAALLVGIAFRFYGTDQTPIPAKPKGNILRRAFAELGRARQADGRPLGKLLGDAVNDSIKTSLMILGFIMFFAVLFKILTNVGFLGLLAAPLEGLFQLLGLDVGLVPALLAGLFEVDLGIAISALPQVPLIQSLIVVSFLVGWAGLSVHAQTAAVLIGTDVRMKPYMIARLLHALLAGVLTLVFWKMGWGHQAVSVMANFLPVLSTVNDSGPHWGLSLLLVKNWFLVFGGVVALSLVIHFFRSARFVAWNAKSNSR